MKVKRQVIRIDEDKCDGCGLCVTGCHEGALQVIDGKARLVSDLLCDGLGACIGECPRGALKMEERPAEPYDEKKVMAGMVEHGPNTIKAHLRHLMDHGQKKFVAQALEYLKERGIPNPMGCAEAEASAHNSTVSDRQEMAGNKKNPVEPCGCPGGRTMDFRGECGCESGAGAAAVKSQLRQWPVQLHLVSPMAPYFEKADLVVAADCTAFAYGNFHNDFIKDKAVIIACPKLDDGHEVYVEKLQALIEESKVNTITVVMMEVPCCGGLLALVKKAAEASSRKVPVKKVVIGIKGGILSEDWV